jgi:hypothetical protein
VTPPGFDRIFETFRSSAFRLATRDWYLDDEEAEDYAAFLAGTYEPVRSYLTDPWLGRVAETTAAGKAWQRVQVIRHPLSDYLRFELGEYEANVDAGEDVRVAIADLDESSALADLTEDFWLFDADTAEPHAVLLRYDHDGRMVGFKPTVDPQTLRRCLRDRDLAVTRSIPLSQYTHSLET